MNKPIETLYYKIIKQSNQWGVFSKTSNRYIVFCQTKKECLEKVIQWESEGRK